MIEKENIPEELRSLRFEIDQIAQIYNDINDGRVAISQQETLKRGFLLNLAISTEAILAYICKCEGITPTTRGAGGKLEENKNPMLNDYLFALRDQKIINQDIFHLLDIIRKWRNRNSHGIPGQTDGTRIIKRSTIDSVNDSFNLVLEWFFKVYLKDKFPDLSNWNQSKTDGENSAMPDPSAEEVKQIHPGSNNGLNSQGLRVRKRPSKSVRYARVLLVLVLVAGGAYVFNWLNAKKGWMGDATVSVRSVNDVYNYLNAFSEVANSGDYDPYDYFIDTVKQYYLKYNQTPDQILNDKSKNDFLYGVQTIDKSTLAIRYTEGNITYWHFWAEFKCYRPSKGRDTKSKVHMEYGITDDWKITAIRQLDLIPLSK